MADAAGRIRVTRARLRRLAGKAVRRADRRLAAADLPRIRHRAGRGRVRRWLG